ncbi:MAG: hypothetical protein P8J88_12495 [Phycisphaerales bacterium]|nr:hypothetical protein [Phycisphaerales bacterium]MDG1979388.1 hypothetical protein [Phycisphaerales bacterium]MDG2134293.1 hypothetical protein [Phycisphaerales bacterium]
MATTLVAKRMTRRGPQITRENELQTAWPQPVHRRAIRGGSAIASLVPDRRSCPHEGQGTAGRRPS